MTLAGCSSLTGLQIGWDGGAVLTKQKSHPVHTEANNNHTPTNPTTIMEAAFSPTSTQKTQPAHDFRSPEKIAEENRIRWLQEDALKGR